MRDFVFGGATAVVTGAASGIGLALVEALGTRGTNLALVDRDEAGLGEVHDRLRQRHPSLVVTTHVIDLAERSDYASLVEDVAAAHGPVTLLVNNAGVALGGSFAQLSLDEIDWLMNVNFRAVMALTKAFLPQLQEPESHLVHVSSLVGLIAPAGQSAYAASKYAVRGLTESLRGELEPRGTGVTVVHPGGVATNIAKNARLAAALDPSKAEKSRKSIGGMLTMPPSVAAALIVRAIEKRHPRLVITSQAKAVDRLARLLPAGYIPLVNRSMSRSR